MNCGNSGRRSGGQASGEPVHRPGQCLGRQQPRPRPRAKSAKASAVVCRGEKPKTSRVWTVETTLPWVSSRICSGAKSVIPTVRSAVPTR